MKIKLSRTEAGKLDGLRSLSHLSGIALQGKRSRKDFFAQGGQRNPLRRLILAKGIQGNIDHFFGKFWAVLGKIWLGFEEFGVDLESHDCLQHNDHVHSSRWDLPGAPRRQSVAAAGDDRQRATPMSSRANAPDADLLSRPYFRAILNRVGRRVVPAAARRGGVEIVSPCAMS
jgi:hypothetical protein